MFSSPSFDSDADVVLDVVGEGFLNGRPRRPFLFFGLLDCLKIERQSGDLFCLVVVRFGIGSLFGSSCLGSGVGPDFLVDRPLGSRGS